MSLLPKFSRNLTILLTLISFGSFCFQNFDWVVTADDSASGNCNLDPDGSQICDEPTHNTWKDESVPDPDDSGHLGTADTPTPSNYINLCKTIQVDDRTSAFLEYLKDAGDFKPLEVCLVLNHLDKEGKGEVKWEELEASMNHDANAATDPILIVEKTVLSFHRLDLNEDGTLSEEELSFVDIEKADLREINVLDYVGMISKLDGKIHKALMHFEELTDLVPVEVKRLIFGSINIFRRTDEDASGGLNEEEYLNLIRTPKDTMDSVSAQEKKVSFGRMDTDEDGEISYKEFQVVIPSSKTEVKSSEQRKSVLGDEYFNSDDFWSKVLNKWAEV